MVAVLAVESIVKSYGDRCALDGVSLSVAPGEQVALLGPNGAGKSTTIGMLSGELRPSGGDGYVCGYSIKTQLMEIFNLCGMCPQFGGLFPELVTLEQHLVLFARLKGMPEKDIPTHVDRVITNFGLEDHQQKLMQLIILKKLVITKMKYCSFEEMPYLEPLS